MKKKICIFSFIALFIVVIVGGYGYFEPKSIPGNIYLKMIYSPNQIRLENISRHLREVEGGYIPYKFDQYLMNRLKVSQVDEEEFKNILGFYAYQALSSRTGEIIHKIGAPLVDTIIKYGKKETDIKLAKGYAMLAYSILLKRRAYKAGISDSNLKEVFNKLEKRTLEGIEIDEI
jgi:hypothetical protein